jgi:elongation factor P
MTISSGEIRRNMTILFDDEVYQVLDWQHRKAPKAPPTLTLKLRNVKTGNVFEKKMPGTHKLTPAPTLRRSSQYLYSDGDLHTFMDTESFEQFALNEEILGDALSYVPEGESLDIVTYQDQPITVELPAAVELEVTWAEPAVKGDTATGATKQITTNTGLSLQVPLFISEGERIKVDTRTGQYLERAK